MDEVGPAVATARISQKAPLKGLLRQRPAPRAARGGKDGSER